MSFELIQFCRGDFSTVTAPCPDDVERRAWINASLCPPRHTDVMVKTDGGWRYEFQSFGRTFYAYYRQLCYMK